jgi:hypothetical protein
VRAVWLAPLLCAACGAHDEPATRALYELERLSFVRPGRCSLPGSDLSLARALVFDRFEATRADARHYGLEREPADASLWQEDAAHDAPERGDWPAFLDFHGAEALAAARGMRLPTPQEWLYVALGGRDYKTPWGGLGRQFFANTLVFDADGVNFSLKQPCNVGSYENGKSKPFGCYDLLGNVWEWVDGVVLGFEAAARDGKVNSYFDDDSRAFASVMGGAYDTLWRPTYEFDPSAGVQRFHARRLDKRARGPSIGVRLCADAEAYFVAQASAWGADEAAHARVAAVGRAWAQDDPQARPHLRTLLAELRGRPGAALGLAWLEEGVLSEP